MSIDKLHERIRKLKNPSMVDFSVDYACIPTHILQQEGSLLDAYSRFCRELMDALKDTVPAVRFRFDSFALLGADGLPTLAKLLKEAEEFGYYVLLDGPGILTPWDAERIAKVIFTAGEYPCDGLLITPYIGSDAVKPFLQHCKNGKDLFVVVRSPNKSALELQDLLSGSRLVHTAAMDMVNRFGENIFGKCGYSHINAAVSAGAADSVRNIRSAYKYTYLLVDGLDYPSGNHKNCSYAFDRFGYGAVVSAGPSVTCAWMDAQSDGTDYLDQAVQAADRMKKNLQRYVTIL